MRSFLLTTCCVIPFVASVSLANAQEDASIVTYDKEYFEKFEVVTLLDMLRRIPGVQEILDKSRQQRSSSANFGREQNSRGFGAGGDQILLDGKRLAGKDNNIDDTLARIGVDSVERVELIRGTAAGLDVQSQGLLVNVILAKGASTSSTFWKVGGLYNVDDEGGQDLSLSHNGSKGALDYTLTAETKKTFRVQYRDEDYVYAGSDVFARNMSGRVPNRQDNHKISANISYSFDGGGLLRLNGLFNPIRQNDFERRTLTLLDEAYGPAVTFVDEDLDEDGNRTVSERHDNDVTRNKWEFGGDYSRNLGDLGSLKALFLYNREDAEIGKNFNKGQGDSEYLYQSQMSVLDKSEMIGRASITKSIADGMSLEIGGEAAINKFDRSFQNMRTNDAADPLVLTSDDNVNIKENRYEAFAIHNYTISSRMSLTSSMIGEFSKIVADNFFPDAPTIRNEAKFSFLKPRFNFRYDVTGQDQVRLTVEKKVSQLDFNNFATSFNTLTELIDFGNTTIRPEQSWEYSAAFEHRFNNDNGAVSLELFYKDYTDFIEKVDFTDYVDSVGNEITIDEYFALPAEEQTLGFNDFISKQGNIDSAKSLGFKLQSSYRLGFIGLPEAVLSFNYDYEKATLTNPFTVDEEIRMSFRPSKQIKFGYRHDVTSLQLSYGGSVTFRRGFYVNDVRLRWPGTPGTLMELFVEKNIFNGMRLRISGRELSGSYGDSTQYIYTNHQRFDDLNFEIQRHTRGPRVIEASIQGTF